MQSEHVTEPSEPNVNDRHLKDNWLQASCSGKNAIAVVKQLVTDRWAALVEQPLDEVLYTSYHHFESGNLSAV